MMSSNQTAQVFSNFVSQEDCKTMIDRLIFLRENNALVKRDDGRIGLIDSEDEVFKAMVEKYFNKAIDTLSDEYTKYSGFIATIYDTGIGMATHIDSQEGEEMGALMYLNDDYEGGELTYTLPNGESHAIKAKAGDMVYCPSWYPHGVNNVTKGTRYFFTVSLFKE